jgi:peptidoglycan-associated lipoprotein
VRNFLSLAVLASTTTLLIACGSDPTPPPAAPTGPTEAPAVTAQPAAEEKPGDNPQQSNISISDEIRKACGITDAEAHFGFNSAAVRDSDKVILKKLADCFSTGPLKGRLMRVVGHADPRGEPEYNMVLGGRRADNVKGAIVSVGLASTQIETTSRGELDATGTDEKSWAEDRRVDIVLGN